MLTDTSQRYMTAETTFFQALKLQSRVMHALMMRELITRFGRENLGVLWLVAEPMMFTLGVATLWSAAGLAHGGSTSIPIVAFAVTGYSSVLMWRNAALHCTDGIGANKPLLFHRSVLVIDVLLTRIALELAGATASFITLSLIFIYIGWMPAPDDLFLVIQGWLMLAWFGASLALSIGGGTALSPLVQRFWHPVSYLLFPLSGAAFMVDWLPTKFQKLVLLLPMVHGVEAVRQGFFGNVVPTHYDLTYMSACCLVQTFVGMYLVRESSRRMEFT
jgi:capsular polysaccharide transport system permease protein